MNLLFLKDWSSDLVGKRKTRLLLPGVETHYFSSCAIMISFCATFVRCWHDVCRIHGVKDRQKSFQSNWFSIYRKPCLSFGQCWFTRWFMCKQRVGKGYLAGHLALDWSKPVHQFSSHAGDEVYGASGQHGPCQCGHRSRCGLYNNLLYSDKAGFPNWSAGGHT
jgi:hypothetical protein